MAVANASMLGTNPIPTAGPEGRARGGQRLCGALSVETFVNQGPLTLTHEDATGWLDYLRRWHVPNFHLQDGGVKVWAYEETYDNWQETYGLDAVLAVYHSGHGGMGADGVFFAPLGATWDGRSDALSSNMRAGNEVVNYLFWSTCNSLRIKEGHDPIRTWHAANLGFRMLFGFETTSVDNGDYGRFFWEEYNRPKSFARAWLDASWRISQAQEPSVVAAGANAQETGARLEHERLLEWGHVSNGWYSWWWYDRAQRTRDPEGVAPRNVELPEKLLVAELQPPAGTLAEMRDIAARHRVDVPEPSGLRAGLLVSEADGQTLSVSLDGHYELNLRAPTASSAEALSTEEAKRRATQVVGEHRLDRDVALEFDAVRRTMSAEGTPGDGGGYEPRVLETTVQFRQLINGLPVISQDAGDVRVTLDNDGRLTRIQNTTRRVEELSDRPKMAVPGPGAESSAIEPRGEVDIERLLSEAWRAHRAPAAREAAMTEHVEAIPETTEVGYHIRGNEGRLVARREVEVDFGGGIRKRYEVIAPIVA